jgi:hypothetical protein
MTEAPKGLLALLGEAFEEMQTSGCDYQTALERRQQKNVDAWESNVVYLDDFRKAKAE